MGWCEGTDKVSFLTLSLPSLLAQLRCWHPSLDAQRFMCDGQRTTVRSRLSPSTLSFVCLLFFVFHLVFEAASLLLFLPNCGAYSKLADLQTSGKLSCFCPLSNDKITDISGSSHGLRESNSSQQACMVNPSPSGPA